MKNFSLVLLVLPTMEATFNKTFTPSSVTFGISKKQSNYTLTENIENDRSSTNSIRNTHTSNITQININQLEGNTNKFELLTTTPRNPGEIPLKEKLTSDISRLVLVGLLLRNLFLILYIVVRQSSCSTAKK